MPAARVKPVIPHLKKADAWGGRLSLQGTTPPAPTTHHATVKYCIALY